MSVLKKLIAVIGVIAAALAVIGIIKKPSSVYKNKPEEKNPMEGKRVRFVASNTEKENADGVRGHLEAVGNTDHKAGVYEKYVKRCIDIILSFGGLVEIFPHWQYWRWQSHYSFWPLPHCHLSGCCR